MTSPLHPPGIARRLRWPAKVAIVLVVCLGIDSAWDYWEARRVQSALAELRARNVPTSLADLGAPASGEPAEAAALYSAAAALVTGPSVDPAGVFREMQVTLASGGALPDALLARVGSVLSANQAFFALVDRASAFRFGGFLAESDYSQRRLFLTRVYDLCGLRTLYHALLGHAAEASAALRTELALLGQNGLLTDRVLPSREVSVRRLTLLLNRGLLTDLDGLATALAGADDDGRLARQLTIRRARVIDGFLGEAGYGTVLSWNWITRPPAAHVFVEQLRTYDSLIQASGRDWPTRADGLSAGGRSLLGRWLGRRSDVRLGLGPEVAPTVARDTAAIRTAIVAVAIERFRRAHDGALPQALTDLVPAYLPAIPTDPFSGGPLLFKASGTEAVVYSVGPDRVDSGADVAAVAVSDVVAPAGRNRSGRDIGVRLGLSPAPAPAGGATAPSR